MLPALLPMHSPRKLRPSNSQMLRMPQLVPKVLPRSIHEGINNAKG